MSTEQEGLSRKGLSAGAVGLLGVTVIGVSCVAPAYTLTAALGPIVDEVGVQTPAVILVGFLPMLFVALGYRELNHAMPDSGTAFTWGTRAFGPWIGWMAGWGLAVSMVLVLSSLAGVAVDFFYLLLSQLSGRADLANLAANPVINVGTCLFFMTLAAWISYRGMEATKAVQYVLVALQVSVLILFGALALTKVAAGGGFDPLPVSLSWFNPFEVKSLSAYAAGLSISVFIFWGWDVTLTMNEETKGMRSTPGQAATATVVTTVFLYLLTAVAAISFAGLGTGALGLGNPEIQKNAFLGLAQPVLGSFAILMSLAVLASSMAALQSTMVGPSRTLLAMAHYSALPARLATISAAYRSPSVAILVSALVSSAFYATMRFLSENVLWDTISALGIMICFYYCITSFAAVWYFRSQWFASKANFLYQFLCPILGGIMLGALFLVTLTDSLDPTFGSGSKVGGVGLVFVIGVSIVALGAVLMFAMAWIRPAFFRGEILARGMAGRDVEQIRDA